MNSDVCSYIIHETYMEPNASHIRKSKNGSIIFESNLQDDGWNRNKRKYNKDALTKGLNGDKVRELMSKNQWAGEMEHPDKDLGLARQIKIQQDNVTHRINKWWWSGGTLKGEVETLNNTKGKDMRNLILQDWIPAFSLRAVGSVKKTPQGDLVGDPLTVICYDWVKIPSHKNAYMTKVLDVGNSGDLHESLTESSEGGIIPIYESQVLDYIQAYSKNYDLISESMVSEDFMVSLVDGHNLLLTEDYKDHGTGVLTRDSYYVMTESDMAREIDDFFKNYI